nr:MAG: hypothetical protein [Bacteriophage sp.]
MKQYTGNEEFTLRGENSGIRLADFWRWAYSDLLNNTSRGVMAEFLVEKSFEGITPPPNTQMRIDWMPYDVTSPSGRRIEVKSAAYLQSWTRDYYSKIIFDIAPKRAWSPETGYSPECIRHSDLYVFCVYTALNQDQSILDLDLWDFYVLPTEVLNQKCPQQKTIGLQSLMALGPVKADFSTLGNTIETIDLQKR